MNFMKEKNQVWTRLPCLAVVACMFLVLFGCSPGSPQGQDDDTDSDAGADTDTDSDTDSDTVEAMHLEGVDILLVVDNSIGSQYDQALLQDGIDALLHGLLEPPTGSPHQPVDDIHFATVTTDMGLSWGGTPYEEGDGWPGANPCSSVGDNGLFQGEWIETTPGESNSEFPSEAASHALQGIDGCPALTQPMQAAATALLRADQSDFVRDDALLAIITVSSDPECSLENGPGFFAAIQELEDPDAGTTYWTPGVCLLHPELLYQVEHFHTVFTSMKGGAPNGVIYAAIAGVPQGEQCEGTGDSIEGCLEDPGMDLEFWLQDDVVFNPMTVCVREEDGFTLDNFEPGPRYVALAQLFGEMGYVTSACNVDWTLAAGDIAEMVAAAVESSP